MKRLSPIALLLAVPLLVAAGAFPASVERAMERYDRVVNRATQEYNAAVTRAAESYREDLSSAMRGEMLAGNAQKAEEIKKLIEKVDQGLAQVKADVSLRQAKWGTEAMNVDVTSRVSVSAESISVVPSGGIMGSDPAPGQHKFVFLDLDVNGKTVRVMIPEGNSEFRIWAP